MKEIFENAELEVIELNAEEIIVQSICTDHNPSVGCEGDGIVEGCDVY